MAEFAVYENAEYKYFLNMEGDTVAYFLDKVKCMNFNCSYIIVDQLFYTGLAENRLLKFDIINGFANMKSVELFEDFDAIKTFNCSIVNKFRELCHFYLNDVDYDKLIASCKHTKKKTINFMIEDL